MRSCSIRITRILFFLPDCAVSGSTNCIQTCETLYTAWNLNVNQYVGYLDRHALACPASKALTRYKLEHRTSDDNIRYEYECCSVYRSTVAIESTLYQQETTATAILIDPAAANNYLDKQTVRCPGSNQLINSLQMVKTVDTVRFAMDCYQLATGFTATEVVETSETFYMTSLNNTAFYDVDVDCNDVPGVEFMMETRLVMTYGHHLDPVNHNGTFHLKCADVEEV